MSPLICLNHYVDNFYRSLDNLPTNQLSVRQSRAGQLAD